MVKTEHHPKIGSPPPPLPLSASHGVERIQFPPLLNARNLSSQRLQQLARGRTELLRAQGRRVIGLPLVLDDGIVLNWVRYMSGVPQTSAQQNERPYVPSTSTGHSSGTSAADAIVIDSDEESTKSPSHPPVSSKVPSASHAASLNLETISYSDSDMELSSPVCLESKARGYLPPPPSCDTFIPPARNMSSDSPPRRTTAKGEVTPSEISSVNADVTSPSSESDESDEQMNEPEVINASRISARHEEPPPIPSLQPIRDLLASRKRRGDPTRHVLPKVPIVAPRMSQTREREELPEKTITITSSESDEDSDVLAFDPQLKRVPLPKTDYGRARRLLVPESTDLPLVAVTMRGDCHFIERKEKYRITRYSLPNPGVFRHVADACIVGDTAVLGCDGGTDQLSFLSVAGKPQMINVTCSPHSSGPRYKDTPRRGVSCLAAIHAKDGHIKFLSGGYDGVVYEWMAEAENLDKPRSRKVVSHGARIMALAYRERDRSMVASVQKKLHVTDLNRRKTTVHPFSNDIQQIHIHPQAEHVTLLEVRHLDHQIQLYDSRKANFDSEPCLSFGYRNSNGKFPATRTRGSVHLVHFAKANEDGCVLLWDFRNCKAVVEGRYPQAEKAVHTIFTDRDIATFGDGVVTFFEDYLAR